MNKIEKIIKYYNWGGRFINDPYHQKVKKLDEKEIQKRPFRYDIINFLLESLNKPETSYLEIGVRDPSVNFDKINATIKYSVDPGIEFKKNPVDFKMTSDEFFEGLENQKIDINVDKFDVIFIDGLHLSPQVKKDIDNALKYINDNGYIVLHDCNPPTEWHAREEHNYTISPAMQNWNGTTWKAFFDARRKSDLYSCCIDTDWGVGVLSKSKNIGQHTNVENPFYEFSVLEENREEMLGLISFEEFKKRVEIGNESLNV